MNADELLSGMSYIDERFVEEASRKGGVKSTWRRWVSLAACLGVLVAGGFTFGWLLPQSAESVHDSLTGGSRAENKNQLSMESEILRPGSDAVMDPELSGSMETPQEMESAQNQVTEVPSVVLRIDGWTGDGFAATVHAQVDTQVLAVGTELAVVFSERTVIERIEGETVECRWGIPTQEEFPSGTLVRVQFVLEEEGIIRISTICKEEEA